MGGGVSIFFSHTKEETEQISLYRNFPCAPVAPFTGFPLLPRKAFGTLAGVSIFDSNSEGGYQNFTVTLRGGYAFFMGTFPEKDHPTPHKKF